MIKNDDLHQMKIYEKSVHLESIYSYIYNPIKRLAAGESPKSNLNNILEKKQ